MYNKIQNLRKCFALTDIMQIAIKDLMIRCARLKTLLI